MRVLTDAQDGEAGLTVALLQSLRWRLDKAATASDRCQVLASYIDSDILQLRQVCSISANLILLLTQAPTALFWVCQFYLSVDLKN